MSENAVVATIDQPIAAVLENGYTSIVGADIATRMKLYTAVSQSTPLSEHLGKPFVLKDIVVQPVVFTNEDTGAEEDGLRTTLIDDKGVARSASSNGVALSVKNLLQIIGEPSTWGDTEMKVQVVEKPNANKKGKFMTIELV